MATAKQHKELQAQVVILPNAFLGSFAVYRDLIKQFVDKGVYKVRSTPQAAGAKSGQRINRSLRDETGTGRREDSC